MTEVSVHAPAVDLLAAMQRKEIGSLELLDAYLARIDQDSGNLNAVVTLDREAARRAASTADDLRAKGHDLGKLHGLPITIKDALLTRGMRTTGGDAELAIDAPAEDAAAVARLRAAGAVIFGKTNLPTGSGDTQSSNEIFGRTVNPWDPALGPGGSSGGSAAAIAAGHTAADLGTDLGGSVRTPASHCGVCGHKPSYGVVPGLGSLFFRGSELMERDMEAVGPMGRTADDLRLMMEVLVDPPGLGSGRPVPYAVRERDPRSLRLAAWFDEPGHPLSAEVSSVLEDAVTELRSAGLAVDPAARPSLSLDRAVDLTVELVGAALSLSVDDSVEPAVGREPPVQRGRWMRHHEWLVLDAERRAMRAEWGRFAQRFDAVLCPVSSTTAFPHDHETTGTRLVDVDGTPTPEVAGTAWSAATSGLHLPATVVPAGLSSAGRPVGIMVVGSYLDDYTNLWIAGLIEAALNARAVPPAYT